MTQTNLNKSTGSLLTADNVNDLVAVDGNGNFGLGTASPTNFVEILSTEDTSTAGSNPILTVGNTRASSGTSKSEILFQTYETDSTSHNRALIRAGYAGNNEKDGNLEFFTTNSAGTLTKGMELNDLQYLALSNTPTGANGTKSDAVRLNELYELAQSQGGYKNLTSSRPSTTTVDIDADFIILVDSTNNKYYKADSVNVTIDSATSGANGLDAGSYAVGWYYNFIIYNPTTSTVSGLHSTSSSSPTLPSGYTFKRLVGAVYCSSIGPVVFDNFSQVDNYIALDRTLITTTSNSSFTAHSCAAIVPPIAKTGFFSAYLRFSSATANQNLVINCASNTSGLNDVEISAKFYISGDKAILSGVFGEIVFTESGPTIAAKNTATTDTYLLYISAYRVSL